MSVIHLASADGHITKYDEADVRERLTNGSLGRETLCWKEGMVEWRPVGTVFNEEPPPPTVPPPGSPWREVKMTYTFVKDPTVLTRALQGMLGIYLLLNVVSLLSHGAELYLLSGAGITPEQAEANDGRQRMVSWVFLGFHLLTSITFLMWIYRANKNCAGFRTRPLRFTPGWAVGWYFVPVMNLFRPYQVMEEIWGVSKRPASRSKPRNAGLLKWWWGFWILSGVLGQVAFRLAMGAMELEALQISAGFAVAEGIATIPLTGLALAVVTKIFRMQKELVAGEN